MTSAGGGTLTATGANGTRYTLAIPAGALVSDETITMTANTDFKMTGMSVGVTAKADAKLKSYDGLYTDAYVK